MREDVCPNARTQKMFFTQENAWGTKTTHIRFSMNPAQWMVEC